MYLCSLVEVAPSFANQDRTAWLLTFATIIVLQGVITL